MVRGGVFSDGLWDVIKPVLPDSSGRRGRPWNDHRRTLEGIVWRYRTGSPWRDLPVQFGAWQSVWERHRRWSEDGPYAAMFAAVREYAAFEISDLERHQLKLLRGELGLDPPPATEERKNNRRRRVAA
jgi:putative transposase